MPNQVTSQNAREFAVWVVQKLRDAGHEALWAGGCVRDQLMDHEPSDYDVATSARPEEVRECFGRGRTLPIGAAFGVITVLGRREQGQIEVATFRCDASYSDGRHPDHVSFSTAREDARRRDFTINGLFYDPIAQQVIDYVGGQDDLHRKVVRAIGDPYERIAEDKLRMLRAVRFATTFQFNIDPDTKAAVRHEAEHITIVSAERIAAEMRKMLVHPNRAHAARVLQESRLLQAILPEANVLWEPAPSSPADGPFATWENTLGILTRLRAPTFRVALAGLLWAIDVRDPENEAANAVCQRWKLSNHEQNGMLWMLSRLGVVRSAQAISWPKLQRVLVKPAISELLTLAEAVALQVDGDAGQIEFCRGKLELPREQLDPAPLITGDDLQRAGYEAGPVFRRILENVRDSQLLGEIVTPQEALAKARDIVDGDQG